MISLLPENPNATILNRLKPGTTAAPDAAPDGTTTTPEPKEDIPPEGSTNQPERRNRQLDAPETYKSRLQADVSMDEANSMDLANFTRPSGFRLKASRGIILEIQARFAGLLAIAKPKMRKVDLCATWMTGWRRWRARYDMRNAFQPGNLKG